MPVGYNPGAVRGQRTLSELCPACLGHWHLLSRRCRARSKDFGLLPCRVQSDAVTAERSWIPGADPLASHCYVRNPGRFTVGPTLERVRADLPAVRRPDAGSLVFSNPGPTPWSGVATLASAGGSLPTGFPTRPRSPDLAQAIGQHSRWLHRVPLLPGSVVAALYPRCHRQRPAMPPLRRDVRALRRNPRSLPNPV
jgi:hypothetical protein